MAETIGPMNFLAEFIKKLSADPSLSGLSPVDLEKEAMRRMKEEEVQRAEARNRDAMEQKARKAKEWADKVKSADEKPHQEAIVEAEKAKYPDGLTTAAANEHLAQTEAVAKESAPEWLQTAVRECPQAVECIARVTNLPTELQNDPNVLYLELAKMNKSVKWSEASVIARHEARVVQDKLLARIVEVAKNDVTFGAAGRDTLLEAVDPGRIHLKTIADIPSAGEEPEKFKKKEHEEWLNKKVAEGQASNLKNTIDTYQDVFDLPENQSLDNQREQLEQLVKELRGNITRVQHLNGVDGNYPGLNRVDAIRYIESAQDRLNSRNDFLHKQQERRYGSKITMEEIRSKDWFVGDALSASAKALPNNKEFEFGKHWTERDVQYLRDHGYRDWFYKYADRVFGLGMERVQPSLAQQYMWEDFQNFIYEMYGNQAASIVTEFQKHWEDRSKYDYIIHAMGLGAGDNKDRLKAMSMFEASDVDYVMHTFKHAGLAYSFMERETFSVLGERLAKYEKDKAWLVESIQNDLHIGSEKDARTRVLKAYSDLDKKNPGKVDKLVELYTSKNLKRDEYILLLDAEQLLTPADQFAKHQPLHTEIQFRRDNVARGVVLEDMDVWGYVDVEIDFLRTSEELVDLEQRKINGNLTEKELKEYEGMVKSLQERKNDLFKRKGLLETQGIAMKNADDPAEQIEFLTSRKGLSPIENKVYNRMLDYLRVKEGKEPNETDIRMAIWAARINIMATGRMASIGAMMARMPGGDRGYHDTAGAKDIMRAPAFEDLVRIMNPEMFAARFGMGGEMGDVMRAYFRFNSRKNKMAEGQSKDKSSYFDTKEWRELKKGIQSDKTEQRAKIMEFAEKDLGIKFSELLATGFMATGAQYDGSSWRLSLGVVDEIKTHYLDLQKSGSLPDKAILDNQALAIRFLIAKNPEERRLVLERMMRRTPTKFFHLFADERQDMLRHVDINLETWSEFENALKYAETDLWNNKSLATRDIDLGSQADFNELVKPYLKTLLEKGHFPASDADIEKYRKLIDVMNARLTAKEHGKPYESIMDGLARESLPLTLSLDDFDWKDANMKTLGNLAFPRRTRDIGNMEQARNILLAFWSNQENILFPTDIKEPIKKLMELRVAIEAYSGTPQAEKVVKQVAQLLIEANRDRSLWSLPSVLPGGKSLGMWMAEQDLRPNAPYRSKPAKWALIGLAKTAEFTVGNAAKLSHKVKPVESFLDWMMPGWKGFSHEPFEKWPHSIAEAISWSVRYSGGHGNHWGEPQIAETLHEMQRVGLFANNPEFVHDMRGEFKAGWLINQAAVARRYWWVVPAATIAVAVMAEMEEEKKGRH